MPKLRNKFSCELVADHLQFSTMADKSNNVYDENFMNRFAYHYARCGSVPKCVAPLLEDFPLMEFNYDDLNALRSRARKKNDGVDLLNATRDEYTIKIAEMQNVVSADNIIKGKSAIDDAVKRAIEHLIEVDSHLVDAPIDGKLFSMLLTLKKTLMELISKHSGLDSVQDIKRAYALGLLKQGKPEEASAIITGTAKAVEKQKVCFMDDDEDDEDFLEG